MKSRPILFSGEMVRAILEGRKSQTRRVVNAREALEYFGSEDVPPVIGWSESGHSGPAWYIHAEEYPDEGSEAIRCPYGAPGDQLWVRETWQAWARTSVEYDEWEPIDRAARQGIRWAEWIEQNGEPHAIEYRATSDSIGPWTPAIHMPRWASRITLEVTGVRVERLQDISEEDAKAEGLSVITKDGGRVWKYGIPDRDGLPGSDDDGWDWPDWNADPRKAFRTLWESIHDGSPWKCWDDNPFVWVVGFRRVTE